jgi:hypothetical protein
VKFDHEQLLYGWSWLGRNYRPGFRVSDVGRPLKCVAPIMHTLPLTTSSLRYIWLTWLLFHVASDKRALFFTSHGLLISVRPFITRGHRDPLMVPAPARSPLYHPELRGSRLASYTTRLRSKHRLGGTSALMLMPLSVCEADKQFAS